MTHNQLISFQDEPSLRTHVQALTLHFKIEYGSDPTVIVRSPARAEILGNHTDYNQGFALAAAISRSILAGFKKRDDAMIRIQSTIFPNESVMFSLSGISKDTERFWTNYPRAVLQELLQDGKHIGGADILIDTNVPKSGGISSSAAFELAIARGMLALYQQEYDPLHIALICQKAENSSLVNSPCGFLDQGTVALGFHEQLVFFDFKPNGDSPVSEVKRFTAPLADAQCSFVIMVDPKIERRLGESGYVARRKMCEESLLFWTKILRRQVRSLREVSVTDFLVGRQALEQHNSTMRKRVEHVVYENNRVLEALTALQTHNVNRFGVLLSESGTSALSLYELDENTPQLTYIVKTAQQLPGVFGARNMGGGFSAIALALVADEKMEAFQEQLQNMYKEKFKNTLDFIRFSITNGTEVL